MVGINTALFNGPDGQGQVNKEENESFCCVEQTSTDQRCFSCELMLLCCQAD